MVMKGRVGLTVLSRESGQLETDGDGSAEDDP